MDLIELVKKITKGEQNRYGEIEFCFSDEVRIESMRQVADFISKMSKYSQEEIEFIQSMIYWSFVDNQNMVDNFLKIFIPIIKYEIISEGFMKKLDSDLTIESRIQHLKLVISSAKRLNLDLSDWKKFVLIKIEKLSNEDKEKLSLIIN